MPDHRRPEYPAPSPSLADHARDWKPAGDPVAELDRAISETLSFGRRLPRETDDGEILDGRVPLPATKAAAEVDAWNARYPVGQAVIAVREDGTSCRGVTTVPAYRQHEDIPVVGVAIPNLSVPFTVGYWPLSRVEPLIDPEADLPTEWNPPTGGTDPWSGLPGDGFPSSSTLDAAAYEADYRNGVRERDAWNSAHPVGRVVWVNDEKDAVSFIGRTSSTAYLLECNTPVVDVVGQSGCCPLRCIRPLTETEAAALESERPGVLPVAPVAPGPRTRPDALAVLCHELGVELLALAEARRAGADWDDGHWKRLRGAIEAAGVVLDAGPRPEWEGTKP
jgi:hypothetical protein